jgi:hypothetical protein
VIHDTCQINTIDKCEKYPIDPDQAAWLDAQEHLPDVVRAGVLRWEALPAGIRAGIEALFQAASPDEVDRKP